jgi:hypothetical protein
MEFVTIKTGILSDNLSGVQIKEELLKSGIDEVDIARIIKIYDKLNFYKFAPASLGRESIDNLIDAVKSLI